MSGCDTDFHSATNRGPAWPLNLFALRTEREREIKGTNVRLQFYQGSQTIFCIQMSNTNRESALTIEMFRDSDIITLSGNRGKVVSSFLRMFFKNNSRFNQSEEMSWIEL